MKTIKVEMELVLHNDSGTNWIAETIDHVLDSYTGEEMTYCKIIEVNKEEGATRQ